jgi:hypothetical protein
MFASKTNMVENFKTENVENMINMVLGHLCRPAARELKFRIFM